MTDRQLLAGFARGASEEAFAEIVRRHSAGVFSVCLRVLGNAHAAEDATQAVFIVLAGKAGSLPGDTVLAGWLHGVARTTALELARKEARRRGHEREAAEMRERTGETETGRGEWREIRPRLDAALAGLKPAQRDVLLLRCVHGRSEAEAADELGWGRSRVSVTLSRALEALRRRLGARGETLSAVALAAAISGHALEAAPAGLADGVLAVVSGKAAASAQVASLAAGTVRAMLLAKLKTAAAVLGAALAIGGGVATARLVSSRTAGPMPAALRDAPANTWVKLAEEPTGARGWPLFYYDPDLGRFVLSGGEAGPDAHFDTETFDPAACRWANAYPAGAPYRAASGPTDAPSPAFADADPPVKPDDNGVPRLLRAVNPFMTDPGMYAQWAYDRDRGRVYAYFQDATLSFDPLRAEWTRLDATPPGRARGGMKRLFGSLGYDPINREIVSIGGTSDEPGGSPGTWAFSTFAGSWRRLPAGSPELAALRGEAGAFRRRLNALVNACRNRFHLTESPAEAGRDLAAAAGALAAEAEGLSGRLAAAGLEGPEARAAEKAGREAAALRSGVAALAGELGGALTGGLLVDAQALIDAAGRVEHALDAEPCGRGASQLATDPRDGKLVLFGGTRLDRCLADTWVYDCRTRRWEQRWPEAAPAARAGHVLAWLPRSGRVLLAGGTIVANAGAVPGLKVPPPRDLWTYDVAADRWTPLTGPADGPFEGVGAVGLDDVLVVVGRNPRDKRSRLTWGMRVDPETSPASARTASPAAPDAGRPLFAAPADYDRAARPDPEAVSRLLAGMPVNQWALLPAPPRDVNAHPWGTSPYDPSRRQFLCFGGGNSVWHFTDVGHYSLRAADWSTGYPAEYPFSVFGRSAFFNQTFNDHPTVPNTLCDAAAFDPVSGKAVFCLRGGTWTYDPAARAWDHPPVPGPRGGVKVNMAGTPRGVVHWGHDGALHLFDAKNRTWSRLPLAGGQLGIAFSDRSGMCYDSKRDCLWLSSGGSPMMQYDMGSGRLSIHASPVAPDRLWMRETAYVPELDMLLNVGRVRGPGGEAGNLAYDIAARKWVGVELACSDGHPRIYDNDYWAVSLSLDYDPGLRAAVLLYNAREVLAARFDPGTVRTFEPRPTVPKAE